MFGRKGLNQAARAPQGNAAVPRQQDAAVDGALAELSQALGLDLDFEIAYIFSPRLWQDPVVADLLTRNGLVAEAAGNKMPLFRSQITCARFATMDENDPVRSALVNSGFGMVVYCPTASNGVAENLAEMQLGELRKIAAAAATDEGKRYAMWDLHMFSADVMKGKVKIG